MQKYAKNMPKNMPLRRLQHSTYANYMQKICKKYAQYATKYAANMQSICRICISLFEYFAYICTPHFADDAT